MKSGFDEDTHGYMLYIKNDGEEWFIPPLKMVMTGDSARHGFSILGILIPDFLLKNIDRVSMSNFYPLTIGRFPSTSINIHEYFCCIFVSTIK